MEISTLKKFCEENNCFLSEDYQEIVAAIEAKKGNCPCRIKPTPCPCAFAPAELKKFGSCHCKLFVVKEQ